MSILTSADWPEVRASIDVRVNVAMLPDATIAMDSFSGAAEREVLEHDPAASGYTPGSVEAKRARLAAVYLTAARLTGVVPMVISQDLRDVNFRVHDSDPAVRAAELRQMAYDEIQKNVGEGDQKPRRFLPGFTRAGSRTREWLEP